MNPDDIAHTLTIPQTAKILGLSVRATYRAANNDSIPVIRIGKNIRVPKAKLYELLGLPYEVPTGRISTHE